MKLNLLIAGAAMLSLAACGGSNDEPDAAAEEIAVIPESLAPFGDGYPNPGAPCRRLGESAATSSFLDDSAMLIGCPSEASAEALGGRIVGNVEGVRLVSVPMGDANAGMPAPAEASATEPPKQALKDPIRSPGGLESKCLARINDMTGGGVIGTNRIEESEAAIAIYVNVGGAEAPWRCLGYRNGTIGEVMYTGSEGAM